MDSGKKGNAISRLNSLSSTLFRGKRSSSGRSSVNSQDSDQQQTRVSDTSQYSGQGEGKIEGLLQAKRKRREKKIKRRREVFDTSLDVHSRKGTLLSRIRGFNIPLIKKDANDESLIREALQRNIVLGDLTDDDLGLVVQAMKSKKVSAKTVLIKQGGYGDNFYIVQKGSFWFEKDGERVGVANVGESFGELALLYNVTRAVSVVAAEDSVVLSLDRGTFRSIMITTNYKKTQMIRDALAKVTLFEGFTPDQLEKLADSVELLNFKKDTLIIEKGTKGSVIYFIRRGAVKCTRIGDDENGVDIILEKEGEHFGERSLITDEVRAADVIAHTDVEVLALDKESFEALFGGSLKEALARTLNLRILKSVPLLHELPPETLEALLGHLVREEFAAGDVIIQQGVEGTKFFIIQMGKVEILKHTKGDNNAPETTVKITELQEGDYFGEGSIINNSKTNAEVKALSAVVCFSVDHKAFREHLEGVHSKIKQEFKVREEQTEDELHKTVTKIEASIAFTDLEVKSVLGRGTFGVVKLVQHKEWGTTYALKVLQKDQIVKFKQQKNVLNEKAVMLRARHPFVLKLYTTFKDDKCLYMLLELIQGGELFTLLRISGGRISGRRARFYASCVLDALLYLHSKQIVYRDLKPENLLIDNEGYIRVVDFGFAKKVTSKTYTLCGTPEYLAPELVSQKGHDRSIDYWALGVLIYEMLEGRSPFTDPDVSPDDEQEYQKVIFNNILRGSYEFTDRFSSAGKSIVRRLLRSRPAERLGMGEGGGDDIRNHKWFNKTDWDKLRKKELEAVWIPSIADPTDTKYFDQDEEDDEIVHYNVKDDSGWDRTF